MLLDLENKTVTLKAGGVLTLAQLWGIIDILDDDLDSEVNQMLRDPVTEEPIYTEPISFDRALFSNIKGVYEVVSDRSNFRYAVVHFGNGMTACSCEDWIYRRSTKPWGTSYAECKHIRQLRWGYGAF